MSDLTTQDDPFAAEPATGDDPFAEAADSATTSENSEDAFATPGDVLSDETPTQTPLEVAAEAVIEALENTAFLSAEPGDLVVEPAQVRRVSLGFGGPSAGVLVVDADARIGRLLVAGALGIDADEQEAAAGADDALCELVNVAAGAMMPRLVTQAGGDAEDMPADACPLGLPQVSLVDGSAWDEAAPPDAVRFSVEGRALRVSLRPAA
ncbi:MAG: hypothetical protein AAGI46_09385 [Planctomycetota bacterium]